MGSHHFPAQQPRRQQGIATPLVRSPWRACEFISKAVPSPQLPDLKRNIASFPDSSTEFCNHRCSCWRHFRRRQRRLDSWSFHSCDCHSLKWIRRWWVRQVVWLVPLWPLRSTWKGVNLNLTNRAPTFLNSNSSDDASLVCLIIYSHDIILVNLLEYQIFYIFHTCMMYARLSAICIGV